MGMDDQTGRWFGIGRHHSAAGGPISELFRTLDHRHPPGLPDQPHCKIRPEITQNSLAAFSNRHLFAACSDHSGVNDLGRVCPV